MNDMKEALIMTLARKARALADIESTSEMPKAIDSDTFAQTCKHLEKWKNFQDDPKIAVLALEREKKAGHTGLVFKRLSTLLVGKGIETKDGIYQFTKEDIIERRLRLLDDLGYTHLAEREKAWMDCSPKEFALF